jgi:hypothetical protein
LCENYDLFGSPVVDAALIVEKSRFSPLKSTIGGDEEERFEIDDFGILNLAGLAL